LDRGLGGGKGGGAAGRQHGGAEIGVQPAEAGGQVQRGFGHRAGGVDGGQIGQKGIVLFHRRHVAQGRGRGGKPEVKCGVGLGGGKDRQGFRQPQGGAVIAGAGNRFAPCPQTPQQAQPVGT